MEFDWSVISNALPILLEGALLTIFIAIISIPLGFIIGIFWSNACL